MGSLINITGQQSLTVSCTASLIVVPPLSSSIDISAFDIIDMEVGVLALGGVATLNWFILTSMQNDFDDIAGATSLPPPVGSASSTSWMNAVAAPATSTPTFYLRTINMGLLRYIRWALFSTSGSGTVTFWMRGIGRRYGRG